MKTRIDLARVRNALEGKKLMGFNAIPLGVAAQASSAGSKTGAAKQGITKKGITKTGNVKVGFTKLSLKA